jgi:hypothetical protein
VIPEKVETVGQNRYETLRFAGPSCAVCTTTAPHNATRRAAKVRHSRTLPPLQDLFPAADVDPLRKARASHHRASMMKRKAVDAVAIVAKP